ncbi:MAG: hypothetical protein ACO1RA_12780 [Planctomycetaceae bacterium]
MPVHTAKPRNNYKAYQFSLRTLLLAMVFLGCVLGWLARLRHQSRIAWEPIRAIKTFSPQATFIFSPENSQISRASRIEELLGIDHPNDVRTLVMRYPPKAPPIESTVGRLQSIEVLNMLSAEGISDDDLMPLSQFPRLQILRLMDSEITGTGLLSFANHDALKILDLSGAKKLSKDAGRAIAAIPCLEVVTLDNCPISEQLLDGLCESKNLQCIELRYTKVSDEMIPSLVALSSLRVINICNTAVTAKGIAALGRIQSLEKVVVCSKDTGLLPGIDELRSARPDIEVLSVICDHP